MEPLTQHVGERVGKPVDDSAREAPTTILDLPVDSFAIVLAHIGVRPTLMQLCEISTACKGFHEHFAEDDLWQILCRYAWSLNDVDLSANWPRLSSYRALYATLEKWAPRQGFHQLVDAFPWGALVLLRFHEGFFIGELMHHRPSDDGSGKAIPQTPLTILEVDFSQPGRTRSTCSAWPPWAWPAFNPHITWCGLAVTNCRTTRVAPCVLPTSLGVVTRYFEGEDLPDQPSFMETSLLPGRLQCRQYVQLAFPTEPTGDAVADDAIEPLRLLVHSWAPCDAADEVDQWPVRLRSIAECSRNGGLTLGLVDGPTWPASIPTANEHPSTGRDDRRQIPQPSLRAGLYIGQYGNGLYRNYSREALMLERRDFHMGRDEAAVRALFRHDRCVDQLLDQMRAVDTTTCVLLTGRKVTGDFHVPLGATTFIAVLEPALDFPSPPERVRTVGSFLRVQQGWYGFGTLAHPGFCNPTFSRGWLVRLEDDSDGQRYAFVWAGRIDTPANVLTQVVAQRTACYLGENDALHIYQGDPIART